MKQIFDSFFLAIQSLIQNIMTLLSSVPGLLALVPTVLLLSDLFMKGKLGFISYAITVLSKLVAVIKTGSWELAVVLLLLIYLVKKQ